MTVLPQTMPGSSGKIASGLRPRIMSAAARRWLIGQHYTSSANHAINGGSNGGLLMGAVLTEHPKLARAVVSEVGVYDMLRVEVDANSEFDTTAYGTVKDPEQFRALYAYSEYDHVRAGTAYPAILLTSGANDGRVNPPLARLADWVFRRSRHRRRRG
jgi:prolyl oligopeptidase